MTGLLSTGWQSLSSADYISNWNPTFYFNCCQFLTRECRQDNGQPSPAHQYLQGWIWRRVLLVSTSHLSNFPCRIITPHSTEKCPEQSKVSSPALPPSSLLSPPECHWFANQPAVCWLGGSLYHDTDQAGPHQTWEPAHNSQAVRTVRPVSVVRTPPGCQDKPSHHRQVRAGRLYMGSQCLQQ